MDTSNIINLGLLGVTAVTTFFAWRSANRAHDAAKDANEIQQHLLSLERQRDARADVSGRQARFNKQPLRRKDGEFHVLIENIGNGKANNVQFHIDGYPWNAHPALITIRPRMPQMFRQADNVIFSLETFL